jgi:hypothetical protein
MASTALDCAGLLLVELVEKRPGVSFALQSTGGCKREDAIKEEDNLTADGSPMCSTVLYRFSCRLPMGLSGENKGKDMGRLREMPHETWRRRIS